MTTSNKRRKSQKLYTNDRALDDNNEATLFNTWKDKVDITIWLNSSGVHPVNYVLDAEGDPYLLDENMVESN